MPNWTLPGGSIKPMIVYHGTDDTFPAWLAFRQAP